MADSLTIYGVGDIAKLLGVPVHRVQYVISRRSICHYGKIGNARVYTEAAAKRIESEIRRIEDERGPRGLP